MSERKPYFIRTLTRKLLAESLSPKRRHTARTHDSSSSSEEEVLRYIGRRARSGSPPSDDDVYLSTGGRAENSFFQDEYRSPSEVSRARSAVSSREQSPSAPPPKPSILRRLTGGKVLGKPRSPRKSKSSKSNSMDSVTNVPIRPAVKSAGTFGKSAWDKVRSLISRFQIIVVVPTPHHPRGRTLHADSHRSKSSSGHSGTDRPSRDFQKSRSKSYSPVRASMTEVTSDADSANIIAHTRSRSWSPNRKLSSSETLQEARERLKRQFIEYMNAPIEEEPVHPTEPEDDNFVPGPEQFPSPDSSPPSSLLYESFSDSETEEDESISPLATTSSSNHPQHSRNDQERRKRRLPSAPSWRIPPGPHYGPKRRPHVRDHPRPPIRGEDSLSDDQIERLKRRESEHAVRSRRTFKLKDEQLDDDGGLRYEDQWGRKLVPVGRQGSFQIDLWPVGEDGESIINSSPTKRTPEKENTTPEETTRPSSI